MFCVRKYRSYYFVFKNNFLVKLHRLGNSRLGYLLVNTGTKYMHLNISTECMHVMGIRSNRFHRPRFMLNIDEYLEG